jgi:hypothetical protein
MARPILPVTSVKRLGSLSFRQRETYTRTRQAHRLMRNAGMSKSRAAGEAGTTARSMDRYLGRAGLERRGTRWQAKRGGRLYSYEWVPTTSGMQRIPLTGRGSDQVRAFKDALWHLATGDESQLVRFEGVEIGRSGYVFEADPAILGEMVDRGELDPREVGSGETAR